MIRRFLFLVTLTFFGPLSRGQSNVNVSLGKPYLVIDALQKSYFRKGNEILAVKLQPKGFILQKFNATTLAFQSVKVYDDFPKNFVVEDIVDFKESYFVFYSSWDGENEQLFTREIDFSTGQFKDKGTKIISVPEKISGSQAQNGFFRWRTSDKFTLYFSGDSSAMLVQYRLKPKKRADSKSYEVIGSYVYNKGMKEQWHAEFTMPYTEKKMNTLDYSVDSRGNVYIVISVYKDETTDEKKRGDDNVNYTLEVLKYSQVSAEPVKSRVELEDKFLHTIWLYENRAKDYMICTGFYNSGNRPNNVDGVLMCKLGKDGRIYDKASHPIPLSILNQNAGRREINKNLRAEKNDKAEFRNLSLRQVLIQDDGSFILMSETVYVRSHYVSNGRGGGTYYYTYHYDDMLITKINGDGNLAWMQKLAKTQTGKAGVGGMSFRYIKGKNTHSFIFLDNEKNKDLRPTDEPAGHVDGAGGFITSYNINDKTGEVTKTYMVDLRDVKGVPVYQFKPSRIIPVSDGVFIFEAYKKAKEDILVRVESDL